MSDVPVTRIIERDIEKLILTKQYVTGDKLPTVRALSEKYKISTSVCLAAYRALEDKGLVVREVGRGTFVAESKEKKVFKADKIYYWSRMFPVNSTKNILEGIQDDLGFNHLEIEHFIADLYDEEHQAYIDLILSLGENGGKAPGMFSVDESLIAPFVSRGLMLDLNDFMDSSKILKREDFLEETLRHMSYNGKLYALPLDFSPVALYFNKKVFRELGVEEPDENWHWHDFLETIKKIGKIAPSGEAIRYGLGFRFYHLIYGAFVFQNLGTFFDSNGNCTIGSDATFEALEFFSKIYNMPECCQPMFGDAEKSFIDLFTNGFCGMLIGEAHEYRIIADRMSNDDFGMIQLPYSKIPATTVNSRGFGISSSAKNPERLFKILERLVLASKEDAYQSSLIGFSPYKYDVSNNPPEAIKLLKQGRTIINSSSTKAYQAITDTLTMVLGHNMKLTRELCKDLEKKVNKKI